MTRIKFTQHELELIGLMCAIASSQAWGEGDYMDWTEKDAKAFDSLVEKVSELRRRLAA